jgi:hypothetical protein
MDLSKLKQFIASLNLTPNIKLFGVRFGVAGHEFGSVIVNNTKLLNSDIEIPTSKIVKEYIDSNNSSKVTYGTPTNAIKSKATLTITGVTPVLIDGIESNIGNFNYLFVDSLSETETLGEVLIGATDTLTLVNLRNAINGIGFGTTNWCIQNNLVSALSSNSTTLIIESILAGAESNNITINITELIDANWDGATLGTTQLGVDGTVGNVGDIYISEDLQSLYMAFANNTSNTGNWVNIYNKS